MIEEDNGRKTYPRTHVGFSVSVVLTKTGYQAKAYGFQTNEIITRGATAERALGFLMELMTPVVEEKFKESIEIFIMREVPA